MKAPFGSRTQSALRTTAISTLVLALLGGAVSAAPAVAADAPLTLVSTSTTNWKYLEDNTDPAGTDADVNVWTKTPFADSAWKTGQGIFGAKRGSLAGFAAATPTPTVLLRQYIDNAAVPDTKTFFFRTNVDITAQQLVGLSSLSASVQHDDALRVFVNGTKVAGVDDSTVTTNLQYAGVGAGEPKVSDFTIPKSTLVAGTNTIAVALYQDRVDSSDIYFNFTSLVSVPTPDAPPAPVVTDLVLNVGSSESARNFAWYSNSGVTEQVQVAKKADATGSTFPADKAASFTAASGATTQGNGFLYQHADASGLVENTTYLYRVGSDLGWSDTKEFSTQDFSGDYNFLLVGDPQIGASGNVASDQAGWTKTLDSAEARFPNSEFIYSAGDQVETAGSEAQYDAFLAPAQLTKFPLATINGNHDVGSKAYEQHYNMPNWDPNYGAGSATASGGDYWYSYNDVLYMTLNSNNRDNASHKAFLENVLAEQGDKFTWKVVGFHHSIYSVAAHSLDSDIIERRSQLPTILSNLDIDLVLMGHDHVYTRSYLMNKGKVAEAPGVKATVTAKDGDVLYITANSASGSKYYDIRTDQTFDFAAVTNQEKIRNFSNVEVTADSITVSTYRSDAMTLVDEVTLKKADEVKPEITVADSTILTGSTFDALAGVTATDAVDGDLTSKLTVDGTVDTAQEGTYVLTYSVSDAAGNTATATRTVTVANDVFTNTAVPMITGSPAVGQVLSATDGTWTPTPAAATYQWKLDGTAIEGATAPTYTVAATDLGKAITVTVAVSKTGVTASSASSVAVTVTAGALVTGKPTVSGTARVGAKLALKAGTWTPSTKLTYQWKANNATIAKATGATYTVAPSLAGKKITVSVTGTKVGYTTATVTTAATKAVAKGVFSASKPKITGTVKVGKTLKASVGTWTPKASKVSYKWYANGKAIKNGTKSSVKLSKSLVGKKITVKVTGAATGYTTKSVLSNSTAKVKKK